MAFNHVVNSVMDQPPDSNLVRALEYAGMNDVQIVQMLLDDVINSLTYHEEHEGNPSEQGLDISYKNLLKYLNLMLSTCRTMRSHWHGLAGIIIAEFDEYPINDYTLSIVPPSPAGRPSITTQPRDLVTAFKCGIKQDLNHFPTL